MDIDDLIYVTMKTLISLITIFTFLTVKSYSQNSNVNALLEKQETRKEIINSILNNHNYMTEFIQEMHGNQHAMMMLNGNNQMTGRKQGDMGMNGSNQMMGNNQGDFFFFFFFFYDGSNQGQMGYE